MKQLVPHLSSALSQQFLEDRQCFCRQLAGQGNDATWYTQAFNPYPVLISPGELALQKRIHTVLHEAIGKLVANYFIDQRLERLLPLPNYVRALLKAMSGRDYRVGSFRPDFVHDQLGNIKICEINARFPTNAYFISHYINNIVPHLTYLPGLTGAFCKTGTDARSSSSRQESGALPISGLDQIPAAFFDRLRCSDSGAKIGIVKGREKGWDVNFLMHELAAAGISYSLVKPEHLKAANGIFFCDGEHAGELSLLYLELHQDEFQQKLAPAVLETLAGDSAHFNDLRTIYLVHDKRFLSLLFDGEIMPDYISSEDSNFLRNCLVPTYVVSQAPDVLEEALQNSSDWVLKPNLFGKGQGIVFGKNVSSAVWSQALLDQANCDYVLQRYIKQMQFSVVNTSSAQGPAQIMDVNVVGTLLCFDEMFFGPGIYRASPGDIVNVAGGGTVLFPVLSRSTR